MPRAIWSGAISFGLVNVPVRMYSAVEDHQLHFNYVHVKDGSRIGYQKICKEEGKEVPDEEIAKGFDWNGEYVLLSDEDFEKAQVDAYKTIDIKDFVDYDQIDPIYFERTYYLGPAKGGEKVYALLARAMEQSGRAAIAKYVMRDRQSLGCLRIRDGVMVLEKMHFADEIRDPHDVVEDVDADFDDRELELANELIDRLAGEFDPAKYHDTYRDTLCEVIKEKREKGVVERPKAERPKAAPDLMEALRASLGQGSGGGWKDDDGKGRNGKGRNGKGGGARDELEGLSKDELYERAKRADVPGRSDMSKDQLVEALAGG
jgi:DNA end-binding protein Ku